MGNSWLLSQGVEEVYFLDLILKVYGAKMGLTSSMCLAGICLGLDG
jgi:hypothetical protein